MHLLKLLIRKTIDISNYLLFIISVLLVLITSVIIVLAEPQTFPTFFDGLWWVMTTVTTVGYGDFYPVTVFGRIIGLFLYIFGIGLIGIVIGKIIDTFAIYRKKRMEGDIVYNGKGHYIIIGWSEKARFAIDEMLATDAMIDIILIDQLEKAPVLSANIFYIKGNASEKATLEKANIKEAKSVLIFANDKISNGQLADGQTLLIASTVESIAPEVYTIVEIMKETHLENFKYVNVDEFIVSDETISSLFVRSAFRKGVSSIFSQLLRRTKGDDLYYVPAKKEWNTYRDAFNDLLQNGATLVADRDKLNINRMLDQPIPAEAELFVICDVETHKKLLKGEG
ncbi:voltage-gated potassium channel [Gracilibacillus ureilyticus]|uniref:Voltage-gated potassium channel n=1 Tax=Gracilibacillus ureilyticus TaxID=531814 RepID=A0A1H9TDI2_9BACI|nr:potassium channel family protein [Gracilibacillus ureilyticus]SER95305.1 voltage-gated potassium channel [Gracilibacillus ureilyticus]